MSAITVGASSERQSQTVPKKLKGIRYKVHILPFQLGFGHIGKFAVIALYYLITQVLHGQHTTVFHSSVTLPNIKYGWDHLFSRYVPVVSYHTWVPIRHLIRDVYEGIFGIFLFKLISWNPYKVNPVKPSAWDKFILKLRVVPSFYQDHPITPVQFLMVPLIITIASLPGLAIGYGLVQLLHHVAHATWLSPHLSSHPSFASKFYADDYDAVVVGIFAGLLAGRSYHPVLDSVFKFFARRRVAKGRHFHFYNRWIYPPAYVFYCNDLQKHPDAQAQQLEELASRNRWVAPMLTLGSLLTFALAAFGYYIIQNFA